MSKNCLQLSERGHTTPRFIQAGSRPCEATNCPARQTVDQQMETINQRLDEIGDLARSGNPRAAREALVEQAVHHTCNLSSMNPTSFWQDRLDKKKK